MKNVKQLARQVAHDNGWPEREVLEEALFIMLRLKGYLIGMHHTSVTLSLVGTFHVRMDKLRDNISFTIRKIRVYRDPRCRITGPKRQHILDQYWKMLHRQLKTHNELALHYNRLKAYYAVKRTKKAERLAEQAKHAAAGTKTGKPASGTPKLGKTSAGPPPS